MGGGNILAVNLPVFHNIGGHMGDYISCPVGFFGAQVTLVIVNFLVYLLSRCQPQDLIPKSCIHGSINFGSALAASGEAHNKISHFCHSSNQVGWQKKSISC